MNRLTLTVVLPTSCPALKVEPLVKDLTTSEFQMLHCKVI